MKLNVRRDRPDPRSGRPQPDGLLDLSFGDQFKKTAAIDADLGFSASS
jgi:hypothetical protein